MLSSLKKQDVEKWVRWSDEPMPTGGTARFIHTKSPIINPFAVIQAHNNADEIEWAKSIKDVYVLTEEELYEFIRPLDILVSLKDYKDANGKDEYYENMQPKAWKRARGMMKEYIEHIQPLTPKIKRIERPPIGILPKYLHDEKRLKELRQAILRYFNRNLCIKTEWIEEYNQLIEAVRSGNKQV